MINSEAQTLVSRLIAFRWLPRKDEQVVRALSDEAFRLEVLGRLQGCGLQFLENPFAEHVAVGLAPETTDAVMGRDSSYISNTFDLPKDAVALLVIFWALLIIPKRQRQYAAGMEEAQEEMFYPSARLLVDQEIEKPAVKFSALVSDFGSKLGGTTRMKTNMRKLRRHGFLSGREQAITEGPLLDLAIDYGFMASRIIEGTLGDLLRDDAQQSPAEEEGDV